VGRSDTSTGLIEKTDGEEDDTLEDKDSDADTDTEGRASEQRDAPARHDMKTRGVSRRFDWKYVFEDHKMAMAFEQPMGELFLTEQMNVKKRLWKFNLENPVQPQS